MGCYSTKSTAHKQQGGHSIAGTMLRRATTFKKGEMYYEKKGDDTEYV
jgi:hypothetical protein